MSDVISQDFTTYTCPMHPEVIQDRPGNCPKCGMSLEPVTPPSKEKKTRYTCPMHPEVIRDEPGDCPKCGMALEPMEIGEDEENAELIDMNRRFWFSATPRRRAGTRH